jgi:ankyrin repeat protein
MNRVPNWNDKNVGGKKLIISFITAARDNKIENVKNLLQRMIKRDISLEATSEEYDLYGNTALLWACYNGNLDMVRLLVEKGGANVNAPQDKSGRMALASASYRGHLEIVRYLVESKNVDINAQSEDSNTALIDACVNDGHLEIVRFLLGREHINVNAVGRDGMTALMWAANSGKSEIVRLLCASGADANIVNKEQKKGIDYASHTPEIRSILLEGCSSDQPVAPTGGRRRYQTRNRRSRRPHTRNKHRSTPSCS